MALGRLMSMQIFTSSNTWNKPPGCRSILVEVWGGGGGGGGALVQAGTSGSPEAYAGGGGAGGYSRKLMDVANISSVAVTIGAGGAGRNDGDGYSGGTSSFGSYLSATGGQGGKYAYVNINAKIFADGGNSGCGSGGDVNLYNGYGGRGCYGKGGMGGHNIQGTFGGAGGEEPKLNVNGGAGKPYAAGGAGAAEARPGYSSTGGAGANGLVIVWEYS